MHMVLMGLPMKLQMCLPPTTSATQNHTSSSSFGQRYGALTRETNTVSERFSVKFEDLDVVTPLPEAKMTDVPVKVEGVSESERNQREVEKIDRKTDVFPSENSIGKFESPMMSPSIVELLLLSALKWWMKVVIPLSYLQYGGHILGLEKQLYGELILRSSELLLYTVKETRLLKFMPSVIAAAIMLWVAREMEIINLNECKDRLLSCLKVAKVSLGQPHFRKRKVCSRFSQPDSPHRVLDAAFSFSTEHSQKSSAIYTVSSPSSSPSVPNKRRITE